MADKTKKRRTSGGTSCRAFNCSNSRLKCPGKSFFRFPKDEARRKLWIQNIMREDLLNKDLNRLGAVVCSDHFEDSQFTNTKDKNRLNWRAVPTIFNVHNPLSQPKLGRPPRKRGLLPVHAPSKRKKNRVSLSEESSAREEAEGGDAESVETEGEYNPVDQTAALPQAPSETLKSAVKQGTPTDNKETSEEVGVFGALQWTTVLLGPAMYSTWCEMKRKQGLTSNDDMALFLVNFYQRHKSKSPSHDCLVCGSPMSPVCTTCAHRQSILKEQQQQKQHQQQRHLQVQQQQSYLHVQQQEQLLLQQSKHPQEEEDETDLCLVKIESNLDHNNVVNADNIRFKGDDDDDADFCLVKIESNPGNNVLNSDTRFVEEEVDADFCSIALKPKPDYNVLNTETKFIVGEDVETDFCSVEMECYAVEDGSPCLVEENDECSDMEDEVELEEEGVEGMEVEEEGEEKVTDRNSSVTEIGNTSVTQNRPTSVTARRLTSVTQIGNTQQSRPASVTVFRPSPTQIGNVSVTKSRATSVTKRSASVTKSRPSVTESRTTSVTQIENASVMKRRPRSVTVFRPSVTQIGNTSVTERRPASVTQIGNTSVTESRPSLTQIESTSVTESRPEPATQIGNTSVTGNSTSVTQIENTSVMSSRPTSVTQNSTSVTESRPTSVTPNRPQMTQCKSSVAQSCSVQVQTHFRRLPREIQKWKCRICERAFSTRFNMRVHLRQKECQPSSSFLGSALHGLTGEELNEKKKGEEFDGGGKLKERKKGEFDGGKLKQKKKELDDGEELKKKKHGFDDGGKLQEQKKKTSDESGKLKEKEEEFDDGEELKKKKHEFDDGGKLKEQEKKTSDDSGKLKEKKEKDEFDVGKLKKKESDDGEELKKKKHGSEGGVKLNKKSNFDREQHEKKSNGRKRNEKNESQSSGDTAVRTQCEQCGKMVVKKNLRIHKRIHTGEKPLSCTECGKYFRTYQSLNSHKRIHNNERKYKCALCDKAFNSAHVLRSHRMVHEPERETAKRHVCPTCGKAFKYYRNLHGHQREFHSGLERERFNCEKCGKGFFHGYLLKNHLLAHEKKRLLGKPDRIGRDRPDLKDCVCKECGRKFSAASNLGRHMKIHRNLKSYMCELCPKRFNTSDNLNQHRKTHQKGQKTKNQSS